MKNPHEDEFLPGGQAPGTGLGQASCSLEAEDPVIKIGDLARLGSVSVKTLRYYADFGLLPPATTAPRTGYRLYSPSQVADLHRIRRLRRIGLGIEAIEEILAEPACLGERLEHQRRRLLEEAVETERRLALLEELQSNVDSFLPAERGVFVRRLEPVFVTGLRARLTSYDEIDELFEEAEDCLGGSVPVHGRVAAWWSGAPGHRGIDAEALLVVEPTCRGARALGGGLAASRVYSGGSWEEAFGELEDWMEAGGRCLDGPKIERYIDGNLTEVSFPLVPTPDVERRAR